MGSPVRIVTKNPPCSDFTDYTDRYNTNRLTTSVLEIALRKMLLHNSHNSGLNVEVDHNGNTPVITISLMERT